jgi:hypothetical protein
MPQSGGTCSKKRSKASKPPAEAPMPTMGKKRPALRLPLEEEASADFLVARADGRFGDLRGMGFFTVL